MLQPWSPTLLLLLGGVLRAQEVSVDTQVLDDEVAATTVQVRLRNDAAFAQNASVTLTLPDDAYSLRMSTSQAARGAVEASSSRDEAAAQRAFFAAVAAGKMAAIAYVMSTCDKCVDVEVNVPARDLLTLSIYYNESLARPQVCVPTLRLNLPSGSTFKRDEYSFTVSVSGDFRQPNMDAQICDVGMASDKCDCNSAPARPTLSESAASFQWKPLPHEVTSGLRVCTDFKWVDKDPVGVATLDSKARSRSQYVVFVLDTGDTITEKDLRKIREIFTNETRNLKEGDTFSVVNYARRAEVWKSGSNDIFEGKRKNVDEAIRYVEALSKDAGSSLVAGLSRALELVLKAKESQQACGGRASVMLITGWTPGGGDAQVRRAVRWLTTLNERAAAALYAVAVGDSVNTCALQELATANGGRATRVRTLQPLGSLVQQSRQPQKPQQQPVTVPQYVEPTIYNLTVFSRVEMRYAVTVITSKVYNAANYQQEVVFSSVLPDNAFVSSFTIEVGGKVYESEVVRRGTTPTTTLSSSHSAKVDTSARDSNVILISLNLAAHGEIIFTLTYEELLEKSNGFYTLRLNVDPRQEVENLLVVVSVIDSTNITSFKFRRPISSKVNEVDFGRYLPRSRFQVNWRPSIKEQQRMLRDGSRQLEVRYQLDQSNPQQIIITDDGHFVHFFSPKNIAPVRKHVVFVLDVSGSMSGQKIVQMKEAFTVILDDLLPTDTFSLVQFSTTARVWTGSNRCDDPGRSTNAKVAAKYDVAEAKGCVGRMDASGGTNLIDALDVSVETAQREQARGAEAMIIALTDGQPDKGSSAVLQHFRNSRGKSTMVFSLALGDDADFPFLQELSRMTGAFARKIYVARDTARQLRNFYRAIASVVLSNINFSYHGATEMTDTDFRAFLNGTEIVVAGKLAPGETNPMKSLQAYHGAGLINVPLPKVVRVDFDNVDRLRAFLMVKQLLTKDVDTALATALKYKFLTPLTSLVVNKPGGPSAIDQTPVTVVEPDDPPPPPPPQPKLCDAYDATVPSNEAINVPFVSGFSLRDLTWSWGDLVLLSKPSDKSNVAFGPCWTSDLQAGNCRHLIHCVLPVFVDNRTRFEADRCRVPDGHVGVCCPNSLFPKVLDQ